MPFAAAAIGAVASAGVGIYAANKQSKSIKNAQDSANAAQEQAQQEALGYQRESRDLAREDLAPWMTSGQNALAPTQALLGLSGEHERNVAMSNFQNSPGYQYQVEQGIRAVNAGSAASGMAASGANLKALQDRGMQLANQDFGTYWNRLVGMTQQGLQAAGAAAGQSIQSGQGMANTATTTGQGIAQTNASAGGAQASIYGNGAQSLGNSIQQGVQNYQYNQRTNALMNSSYNPPVQGNYGMGAVY